MKAKSKGAVIAANVVCYTVTALVLAIVLTLNIVVGVMSPVIDKFVIGYQAGSEASAHRESGATLVEQIQEEGTVLVQNNDDVLPLEYPLDENGNRDLTKKPKVNVFGWASVDWVYSGSGSGQARGNLDGSGGATKLWDLYNSLEDYGVEYNTDLKSMYTSFQSRRNMASPYNAANSNGTLHSFNYEFSRLYEPTMDAYSDTLLADAKAFSDTALVVIGRTSGESNDSPKVQYKKTRASTSASGTDAVDYDRTYLEISTEEEELLKYVGANYDKVIVLINSTNVMELGFMEQIPGLDACLIVATTGTAGARAIPSVLYGLKDVTDDGKITTVQVAPSGRTADTFAYDLSTSSTYVNTGSGIKGANSQGQDTTNFYSDTMGGRSLYPTNHDHTNGSTNVKYSGVAYTDYAESIYVGYKWYETADAEGFWESAKAKEQWGVESYEQVVQYPFGFGLSYTKFKWEITDKSFSNSLGITLSNVYDELEIEVTVTNVGEYPGQDVVQLYYTPPYNVENGKAIEKSAVNLIAFGKTQTVLEPGATEIVKLKFKAEDMKSYDCYDENDNGFTGYELEAGTYTLTLRTDAHTVATSRMSSSDATIDLRVTSGLRLDEDSVTKNEVKNLFTGTETTDGVAIDGNSDGTAEITYLSRTNFVGTFPYEQKENRAMNELVKAYNLYTKAMADEWDAAHDTGEITTNASGSKVYENDALTTLGLLLGDPDNYDNDALWDSVLDQLTIAEMQNLVLHGYTKTSAVGSIGKPETLDVDGPNQVGSFMDGINGTTGFSSIVLAQSWNIELAYSMGLAVAQECASRGVNGWYGPAINLHRSPFGGRNYEYYSEDALISGLMSAKTVEAAKNGGVFCYLKHLCLYESESNRDGMYNWLTEQALREVYVKPFEICIKEGGATGIMTSYGRIGAVWTGGSEALLTELVRNEWGFKGAFLTDYADYHDFMNADQMVRAGGDIWMDGWLSNGSFSFTTSSNAFRASLRRASKNIIYMWTNALATQADYNAKIESGEITEGVAIVTSARKLNFRWYIPVLVVVDVVAVAGSAVWIGITIALTIAAAVKSKKKKAATESDVPTEGETPAEEGAPAESEGTENEVNTESEDAE